MTDSASTARVGAGLPADLLATLDSEPVEARSLPVSPATAAQARAAEWELADLWLPAVVLSQEALSHNLDRFANWCQERGVALAPHGKTTMSPHLWSSQLARGAWAITAATAAQARVMRRFGVPRVLIANEVTEPHQVRWLAECADDPAFEVTSLVDSRDAIRLMEQHVESSTRPLPVLVELGVQGRRTGARSLDAAFDLAEQVVTSPELRLAGVEGYEGVLPQLRDGQAERTAGRWLDQLTTLVTEADRRGLFADSPEIIVTAGGSGYPDLVAEAFSTLPQLSRPTTRVIRSGCYVTHDDLSYERSSPLRSGADPSPLQPALSCYAAVISTPEPGRALLGVGKRDVAFDIDLPVPRAVLRDGRRIPVEGKTRVVELNDHHAFCDTDTEELSVGDVLELGLSHPCTVFDKWQLIPVLDDDVRVVDAIRTVF